MTRLFLAAPLWLAACNPCLVNDCIPPPSVEISVTDAATHGAITAFTIVATSEGKPLSFEETCATTAAAHCRAARAQYGSVEATISATGYEEQRITIPIPEDACGVVLAQHRDVALQPVGSLTQALVTEGAGAKACGQE